MGRRRRNNNAEIANTVASLIALGLLLKFVFGIDVFHLFFGACAQILLYLGIAAGAGLLGLVLWKGMTARPAWDVQPQRPAGKEDFRELPDRHKPLDVGQRLDRLDWFQLEKLVAVLFEQSAYTVQMRGGANPDGGIDLVVGTEGSRIAVQCKQWATWKCGVSVVRELMGAMVHEEIGQGYLVAREVTAEARALAEKHGIGILDRERLVTWIGDFLTAGNPAVLSALEKQEKQCPKCGAPMVLRKAAKGRNAGNEFWGCSTYPRCHGIIR